MRDDRISRAIRHLERNSKLEMAPGLAHVQFIKDGIHFYMPNTFHMSPTMKSISLNNNKNRSELAITRLEEIINDNNSHVPMLICQLEKLKQLKNVYFHNFNCYEKMKVFMYLNWPIRDICILGKVMGIREANFFDHDHNLGFITIDNNIKIPDGTIKSNEYLLFIEDGTSQKSVTVRISPQIWNFMMLCNEFKLELGSKVQIWGIVNILYNQIEISARDVKIVGKPQNLYIETNWWQLCLETKTLLDEKWCFSPLKDIEYPDLDIVISFTERENIIEINDSFIDGDHDDVVEAFPSCVWVPDLGCTFDDYLNLTLSIPIDVPNNEDIEILIFEKLLDFGLLGEVEISIPSILNSECIFRGLTMAITSTMIEDWSQFTDNIYLGSRWEYTDFKACISVLLKQNLNQLVDSSVISLKSDDIILLATLIEMMKIINNKLNILPIGSSICTKDVQILLKLIGVTQKEKYVAVILEKVIGFNADKYDVNWKHKCDRWEKGFKKNTNFAAKSATTFQKSTMGLHNRLMISTTELIKCLVFQIILRDELLDLDSIMANYDIKLKLNTLIFSKISDTCGSIQSLDDIINVLEISRTEFDIMKRRILIAIILLFESSHILKLEYDGYLDRQALIDYNFKTISVRCLIDDSYTQRVFIPEQNIQSKEIRTKFADMGIKLNLNLTNCFINHILQRDHLKTHFISKTLRWFKVC